MKRLIRISICLAVCGAILFPVLKSYLFSGEFTGTERFAHSLLNRIVAAEKTYKETDPDRNGKNDYWISDVAGLYYALVLAGYLESPNIEYKMALADGRTAKPDYAHVDKDKAHLSSPVVGHWFFALEGFEEPDGKIVPYSSAAEQRFGFIVIPITRTESFSKAFIINEQGVMYWKNVGHARYFDREPEPGRNKTDGLLVPELRVFPHRPEERGWKRVAN